MARKIALPEVLLALAALIVLVEGARYYGELPAVMATNFDGSGDANATMSKNAYYWLMGLITVLLVAIGIAVRRRHSGVAELTAWMLFALLLFELVTFELVVDANLGGKPFDSTTFVLALCAFFAFLAVWLLQVRRARKTTGSSSGSEPHR